MYLCTYIFLYFMGYLCVSYPKFCPCYGCMEEIAESDNTYFVTVPYTVSYYVYKIKKKT